MVKKRPSQSEKLVADVKKAAVPIPLTKIAYATIECEDGKLSIRPEYGNKNVSPDIDLDDSGKVITITLIEKPACHPTVLCAKNFTPVLGADFNQFKLVGAEKVTDKIQVSFLALYL